LQVLNQMSFEQLGEEFTTLARRLDGSLRDLLETMVVDPLYDAVGQRLQGLPPVAVGLGSSPKHAWQLFQDEDRRDADWRARFPVFRSDQLFAPAGAVDYDRRGFDGRAYLALVREKIRLVNNETLHTTCARLRQRLRSLLDELALLARKDTAQPAGC
jgi:hypothetical protein